MSGSFAPALVAIPEDPIEYIVFDNSPVSADTGRGYSERHIHGETFKRYPDVNCTSHSHPEAVLAYATSIVPLVPVFHMVAFLGMLDKVTPPLKVYEAGETTLLGEPVPVCDITELYTGNEPQNLLVSNAKFGAGLAAKFSKEEDLVTTKNPSQDHSAALMKKYGPTTLGVSTHAVVFRALYTQVNAGIQTSALLLQNAVRHDNGLGVE